MSIAIPCLDASGEASNATIKSAIAAEGPLSPEDLDALFGPVALFPDAVLTPLLVAVTFPLDVVKAGRFVAESADLSDQERSTAASKQDWDPTVRQLAAGYPGSGDPDGGGDRVTIGGGDRTEIGGGNRVTPYGEGNRANQIGDRTNRAGGDAANRNAARQKIETRQSSGRETAKLPATRPAASKKSANRPEASRTNAASRPSASNRATQAARPTQARAPSASRSQATRSPSRSNNAMSSQSRQRASASSSRGRQSARRR